MTTINGVDVTPATAADVTTASFWELARRHELSPDVFNSPAGAVLITKAVGGNTSLNYSDPQITAALPAAWAPRHTSYMLDWSAPKSSGTIRPTLCNRDYWLLFDDKINVVFADSHVAADKDFDLSIPGKVIYLTPGSESDSIPDDIMSNLGDEVVGRALTDQAAAKPMMKDLFMGRGNQTRAAMK